MRSMTPRLPKSGRRVACGVLPYTHLLFCKAAITEPIMTDHSNDSSAKAWAGRFSEPMSELVKRYTASVSFDRRMWRQDIRASLAHATMLARQGIIGANDLADHRARPGRR
jgi:hypothetical protein